LTYSIYDQTSFSASQYPDAGDILIIHRGVCVRIDGVEIVQQPSNDAGTDGRWRRTVERRQPAIVLACDRLAVFGTWRAACDHTRGLVCPSEPDNELKKAKGAAEQDVRFCDGLRPATAMFVNWSKVATCSYERRGAGLFRPSATHFEKRGSLI
jgi:hypothetical protein